MYSHGWEGGPEVAGGSKQFWSTATKLNWTSNANVVFHGCNTANFAGRFAQSQNVVTYGQNGYASFSKNSKVHIPISRNSLRVYLYHFEIFNLFNKNGYGKKYQPAQMRFGRFQNENDKKNINIFSCYNNGGYIHSRI